MLLLSEGEFPVVLDGCGCGFLGDAESVLFGHGVSAGVGWEDGEGGGGWASGDGELVADADAGGSLFVGVASVLECPDFAVGGEGVGFKDDEEGAPVVVPGGECWGFAAWADSGGWVSSDSVMLGGHLVGFLDAPSPVPPIYIGGHGGRAWGKCEGTCGAYGGHVWGRVPFGWGHEGRKNAICAPRQFGHFDAGFHGLIDPQFSRFPGR